MCGIVGYIGRREAQPIIVEGLMKLEYRGYDSFGVATVSGSIELDKHQGRISDSLRSSVRLKGKIGVGHTRWATHGIPNDINAHPHMDCSNRIAVVHNGIIENYAELKRQLISRGHIFRSETDTEVVAHLVEEEFASEKDLFSAVQRTIPLLKGSYALLVIATGEDRIISARYASPLVIGVGDGEFFAASDMTPVIDHTERAIFLEDGDIASISRDKIEVFHTGKPVQRPIELV
ncbi:MAG: glutamine--fructose-6-phosphate aminotransferase, partial [Methanoregula sp.]|nr:glutamine--fructose-6-phosphate aminotransferase [Methanoregula sp.]